MMKLSPWAEENAATLSRRWHAEIRVREDRRGEEGDGLLKTFTEHMVAFLPPCFGEKREEAEGIWLQAAHLYGSFALMRGLSAGEVVEELHLLREELMKLILPELAAPRGGEVWTVRDVMSLNRLIDKGVVRASVAYMDDLFFAHLQGSGVPGRVTPEVDEEIRTQLEAFSKELGVETNGEGKRPE